ncbi:MAG: hypothetical protein K2L07_04780 [Lachnospiraceae bacterium]|nr:hypothetical protein [Lachnospiraceae bacterium]
MYLEMQKEERKEKNVPIIQRQDSVKQRNTGDYNVRIRDKKEKYLKYMSQQIQKKGRGVNIIQRKDGIEKGIIVYVKGHETKGTVVEEKEATYIITIGTINIEVQKDDVVPMYSNEGKSNETFDSVMEYGILSPSARAEKGVSPGATTRDSRMDGYNMGTDICVNTFSIPGHTDIFNGAANGAYLIALENSDAPAFRMPSVDECEKYLNGIAGRQEQLAIIRQYFSSTYKEKVLNLYIQAKNEELTSYIRDIFQERIRRTMLIIANADESETNFGENRIPEIAPNSFVYILLPENSTVSPEKAAGDKIVKVSMMRKTLLVPIEGYFADADGNDISGVTFEIDLDVPNYEEVLGALGEGTYHSHLVRL